jgi:hypothetical protein
MSPHLERWRCDVCREAGSVPYARSTGTLLHRILARHYERSPECELAPIGHDGGGWVLRRPQPEAATKGTRDG